MEIQAAEEAGFDPDRLELVRQAMRDDMAHAGMDGVALRVGRRGQVVFDMAEGMADRRAGRPVDENSVFPIFALSKQIVSVLALMLVERGKLQLHQPIAELLPQFRVAVKDTINLYHLLTFTSGLYSFYPPLQAEQLNSIESLTDFAAAQRLECLPGERVCYSMFAVHAVIASLCVKADGERRSFARMLEEELFQPLGMSRSSLGARDDLMADFCPIRANFSDDVSLSPEALEGLEALLRAPGGELPGAGCIMSLSDLYRFTDMLRNGGALDGTRILSPATIRYMTRVHTPTSQRNVLWDPSVAARKWTAWPANQGLGFWIRGTEGVPPGPMGALMSPGAFGGFGAGSAGLWVDPEYDLSIAFLSTGLFKGYAHLERLGRLTNMIVAALAG